MGETQGRLTLWAIEVFLVSAEEGAVSAAARRLGASVSGVSQQLTALEAALGAELFDRSVRPMRLTPAGEMFRRRARVILTEAQEARAELAAGDLSGLTRFRLGMIEDFEADVTPRLLTGMAEELKRCQFLLETGPSHRLLDQLDSRALDMVVAAEMGAAADWMEVHALLAEPYVVAVPRGVVPAAEMADGQGGALLARLQDLPLIVYSKRHAMGRQIAAHLEQHDFRPGHRFEMDSYHAIMAMVAEGLGWTILTPLGYLRAQRFRDRADVLPLPFAPLSRRISLTARKGAMGTMPEEVADRLRGLLQEMIVTPARARLPWLEGALKVL